MIELHENVLTTDYVEDGVLHYFTYATEWSDKEHVIEFKTTAEAVEWYEENMRDRCIDEGRYWYWEMHDDNPEGDFYPADVSEADALEEWRSVVECLMLD